MKGLSEKDELYENLELRLRPLVEFLKTLEDVHESETSAMYSMLCISRQHSMTTSLGLLERVKHLLLDPAKHIDDTLPFVV